MAKADTKAEKHPGQKGGKAFSRAEGQKVAQRKRAQQLGSSPAPNGPQAMEKAAGTRLHWQTGFHPWPTPFDWYTLWNPEVSYFLPKLIPPNQLHH